MISIRNSFDNVLKSVVSLLEGKDNSVEKVEKLIRESTPNSLLPTFYFLNNWIETHTAKEMSLNRSKITRIAFQLFGFVSGKIPPILIVMSGFDLNQGINSECSNLSSYFMNVHKRISQIKEFLKPQNCYGQIFPFPINNDFKDDMWNSCDADLSAELGNSSSEGQFYIEYFRKMMLNKIPIQYFKPYIEQKIAQEALTMAVISIIQDINNKKDATHFEILASFTYVMEYAQTFILSHPSIPFDTQLLCSYIQSMPTISPFLEIAIMHQVQTTNFLYQMLTPNESIQKTQYLTFDKSNDILKENLSPAVANIDKAFHDFFIKEQELKQQQPQQQVSIPAIWDLNSFLEYILYDKTENSKKTTTIIPKPTGKEQLTPNHIFALGYFHMNKIVQLINRSIEKCAQRDWFKDPFVTSIKHLVFHMAPTMSDTISNYTLNAGIKQGQDTNTIVLLLNILSSYMMPVLLHSPNDSTFPFALEALKTFSKENRSLHSPRHLIRRLLLYDRIKLGPKTINCIKECQDVIALLLIADALSNPTMVHTCSQREEKLALREEILNSLPFEFEKTEEYVSILNVFDKYDESRFNKESNELIHNYYSIVNDNPRKIQLNAIEIALFSSKMRSEEFAATITKQLNQNISTSSYEKFPPLVKGDVDDKYVYMSLSQQCIKILYRYQMLDIANPLLQRCGSCFISDNCVLHWIYMFTQQFRAKMDNSTKTFLYKIVIERHDTFSDVNLLPSINSTININTLINLLIANDGPLIQPPKSITNEYLSPFFLAMNYCQTLFLLSEQVDKSLISTSLIEAVYSYKYPWANRTEALVMIGRFVSGLTPALIKEFIKELINREACDSAIICGRVIFAMCGIDVFLEQLAIGCPPTKIDFFMKMVLPSFYRVHDNKKAEHDLIDLLLQTLSSRQAKNIQNTIIDIIGFLYIKLELNEFRNEILSTAKTLLESDKLSILEAYLDPDFKQENKRPLFRPKFLFTKPIKS